MKIIIDDQLAESIRFFSVFFLDIVVCSGEKITVLLCYRFEL